MNTADVFLHPRQLIQHERVQQPRLRRIAAQLARDGIREPVAVTPLPTADPDDRFFVLDGAHRSTAAALNGIDRIPCTVVDLVGDPQIGGWTHVVRGLRMSAGHELAQLSDACGGPVVASLRIFGRRWQLHAADDSAAAVHRAFHRVGALYGHLPYDRSPGPVPGAWCQVTWRIPPWTELVDLVTHHGPLPAGVTRFDIEHRVESLPVAA